MATWLAPLFDEAAAGFGSPVRFAAVMKEATHFQFAVMQATMKRMLFREDETTHGVVVSTHAAPTRVGAVSTDSSPTQKSSYREIPRTTISDGVIVHD
jgi:hypothetical protein